MPTAADTSPTPTGTLVAWGGGGDNELLSWLGERFGGTGVEVVVAATPVRPLVTGRAYVAALRRRGFSSVSIVHPTSRTPMDARAYLKRLETARLVFFTGGDQECLTEALGGSRYLEMLRERYRTDGLVVAGTSAGAAALADQMIVGGHGWRSLMSGRVRVAPGLGLVEGAFFDSHFSERNRFGRLAHAVLRDPDRLGVGIGEETGVVCRPESPGCFEVLGEGVVTVVDGRDSRAPGLKELPYGHPISGRDLKLHLLTAGDRFGF
ncbi:MAG TPA: cyanophycinase [bacterium]|nr:cyanophycinase [bacterium]